MTGGRPAGSSPLWTVAAHRLPQQSLLPPYQLVAADLRQQILSGQLQPGERLPTSRALQEHYGIANMTARSAVRILRDEGLVHTAHGRGSFVADPLPPAAEAPHPTAAVPPRMPTPEYTELTRRIDELTHVQNALLHLLGQAGRLDRQRPAHTA
ncbi:winged helix-turn-helix domain-containing protein [Streptomyces sp. HUAS TT20]|uniref:winged helix-turn-helix domain-containing protein n=1 Tax=Streptomyces sp. HUAS TT20 TaxID=3447509 RepID=UPI0021D8D125|nr:GntR family transcriptional regulator [Streptomyces sp. HUAS 15-9]UXY32384.1 GntR family transcriptional regulator [Streptomyces sp. HUAS 15-9]